MDMRKRKIIRCMKLMLIAFVLLQLEQIRQNVQISIMYSRLSSSGDKIEVSLITSAKEHYLEGKKIATNRKPRFEQKDDALSDWYSEQVKLKGKEYADKLTGSITVKKSTRSYNSKNRVMPGTTFYYNGKRLVLSGQTTRGKYYKAYGDPKTNYPAVKCQIYKHNEGLAFV